MKKTVVMVAFFALVIFIGCGKSAADKDKLKADCAKTAIENSDACKACCQKAGFSGHSYMSAFMTGDKATCECL